MNFTKRIALVHIATLVCAAAEGAPVIRCDAPTFDFGTNVPTATVAHEFAITNAGDGILVIEKVNTGCGCTTSSLVITNVPPGEQKRTNTPKASFVPQ